MASKKMVGVVRRIKVTRKGFGRVTIYNVEKNEKKEFYLWSPLDKHPINRITFSMWLSMLQTALTQGYEVLVRYPTGSTYVDAIEMPEYTRTVRIGPKVRMPPHFPT